MREKRKAHGAHAGTWVNGRPDHERHRYWLVDNVATNGESKVEGYDHLDEDAYLIKEVIPLIFVDRGQGAIGRLKALGHAPVVVYHLRDLTFAFGELGLWPKETVARAEEEIELHRRTYTL